MFATAYRAPLHAPLPRSVDALASLVALRKARIAAGLTLALMLVAAIAWPAVGAAADAPLVLVGAWPTAAAAGLATYWLARTRAYSGESPAELERTLYALEVPGLAVPAAGLAFALPLTSHLVVASIAALVSPQHSTTELREFSNWMVASAIIVGHAHVAVAIHAFLTVDRMHRLPSAEAPVRGAWLQALGIATLCGALPGAILILLPPLIVLATGLPLLPALYGFIRRTFMDERARIAATLGAATAPVVT